MNIHYVYLLQEREFVNSKENIYKIGKTKKLNFIRFKQYPKGSILLFQSTCNDCNAMEKTIMSIFKQKFTQRKDIGREYFEGNHKKMIKIMNKCIENEKDTSSSESSSESDCNIETIDDIEVYQCVYCLQLFEFVEDLQEHNKKKCVDKYQCNICEKIYERKSDHDDHKKRKKPCLLLSDNLDSDYVCNICNSGYTTFGNLKIHQKTCIMKNSKESIQRRKIEIQKQEDENNKRIIEFKQKLLNKRKLNNKKLNNSDNCNSKYNENKTQETENSQLLHKIIDMIDGLNLNKTFDNSEHISDSESNIE